MALRGNWRSLLRRRGHLEGKEKEARRLADRCQGATPPLDGSVEERPEVVRKMRELLKAEMEKLAVPPEQFKRLRLEGA